MVEKTLNETKRTAKRSAPSALWGLRFFWILFFQFHSKNFIERKGKLQRIKDLRTDKAKLQKIPTPIQLVGQQSATFQSKCHPFPPHSGAHSNGRARALQLTLPRLLALSSSASGPLGPARARYRWFKRRGAACAVLADKTRARFKCSELRAAHITVLPARASLRLSCACGEWGRGGGAGTKRRQRPRGGRMRRRDRLRARAITSSIRGARAREPSYLVTC